MMEFLLGFLIAAMIAMTGVGAGTVTAPLLILLLHLPAEAAVGTALAYSAAVKLVVVPVHLWRRTIAWRTLGLMLATGLPGVVVGALLFRRVAHIQADAIWLYLALGVMIAFPSAWTIYRHFRPAALHDGRKHRPRLLALAMLPVGAEVGFSSSGAGALGTLALMCCTPLETTRIVGTDLAFGLCLALVGGGMHLSGGAVDLVLLQRLVAGGVLGAIVGASLASHIPARAMRLALSLWLLAMGMQLCWQAFAQAAN